MSTCSEAIVFVGDVKNLDENRGACINNSYEKIMELINKAKGSVFVTIFYGEDDPYSVGKIRTKVLSDPSNAHIKFKQISSSQELKNYIKNGMDRNEHPVRSVEMIYTISYWETKGSEYMPKDPKAKQVPRELVNELGKQMILSIFTGLGDKDKTKPLTFMEVIEREYHWNKSSTIGDSVLGTAGNIKGILDTSKSRVDNAFGKKNPTRAIRTKITDLTPEKIDKFFKIKGSVTELYDAKETFDKLSKTNKSTKELINKNEELFKECMNDANNPQSYKFGEDYKCISIKADISEKIIMNFQDQLIKDTDMQTKMKLLEMYKKGVK